MNTFISPTLEEDTLKGELEDLKNFEYGYQPSSLTFITETQASITLLENIKLTLELSLRGFKIIESNPKQSYEGKIFESMDSLLSHCSPLYREKFSNLLMLELSKLKELEQ